MKLSDFPLRPGNHFVAMEYHTLILNRTLLILRTEDRLVGIVANGVVSAKSGTDPLTSVITTAMAVRGDLRDPMSYLRERYLARVKDVDLFGPDLRKSSRANFCVRYQDVSRVSYDPGKKWGMAYYPHDGKVFLTMRGKTREFIVLGDQSGQAIAEWLVQRGCGAA